jgi:hypothetical protein
MKTSTLAMAQEPSPRLLPRSSITIASWNDVLVLVRETDRHGQPALFIRVTFGEMAPRRFGPFPSLKQAKACHRDMAAHLEDALLDEINNLGDVCSRHGSLSSGLHNIEF